MYRLLNDWFPGGAHLSSPQVQVWRGVRGHLPDGLPAVGASGRPGVWLNLAHGSHGASLAAGCARALADMLAGRPTAIDMQAFSPLRF
jgi:D-amino-acid dehydrogenase